MLESLLNILFPPVCVLCGRKDREKGHFCPDCLNGFAEKAIHGPLCIVCGAPFPAKSGPDRPCGRCLIEKAPYENARSPFTYDGKVAEAVHRFKYAGAVTLSSPLGALAAGAAGLPGAPDAVVPVPLHIKRLRARGFNQSLLLAREAARRIGSRVDYLNLKRTRNTPTQVELSVEERKKNVLGAFEVRDAAAFKGKTLLLVDDVMTTGATVNECSKALKKAGARAVHVLTLARSVKV